jgi:signal transduction histidine kinase
VGVTSTETRTTWSERLSPRNWSLAWKLVAVGLVPALLALVLGVLRVADQAQTASELEAANRLLEVRTRIADTADALRVERDRATAFIAERRLGDRGPLQEAIRETDGAWEQARVALVNDVGLDATSRSALREAEGGLAQLPVLRSEVGGSAPLEPGQVVERYTSIVGRTDVLGRALLRQLSTPEVIGLADALTAATAASEALARQHTVLGAALRVGRVSPEDRGAVTATDAAFATGYGFYLLALGETNEPVNFVASPANAQRDAVKAAILGAPDTGPIPVTVAQWDDSNKAVAERIEAAGTDVRAKLTAAGDAAASRSSNLAGLNSVILMLGLLLAAAIIVLVARSLTRSLRVLRTSALDVAQRRLPQAVENMRSGGVPDVAVEPVPLHNRDEVGQVARAFDTVHGQALRLAADQAALQTNVSSMFVNLSRRSQALVERQLQLIEQLESNEQDPDQLSNLFQLDHLATRMRRNSENLLVLAGTDLAKRNVAPVPLVDVLRAAVSEIEQYQRIVVQAPPQATIVGRSSNDIVHLLAELLDNATNFSPPDSQVVMTTMRIAEGSILVEIADRGVGMLDHELSDANRRLATPSTVDVSASRRMGLFVVGRLAARHGIGVHLGGAPMGGPGGGLTASVTLPAHLVVSVGEGDARVSRTGATALATPPPNGVPPQRVAHLGRPAPPAPAGTPPKAGSAAVNGLPLRTPGSSLRRGGASPFEPAAFSPDPATTEQAVTGRAGADTADGPAADAPGSDLPRRIVRGRPAGGTADGSAEGSAAVAGESTTDATDASADASVADTSDASVSDASVSDASVSDASVSDASVSDASVSDASGADGARVDGAGDERAAEEVGAADAPAAVDGAGSEAAGSEGAAWERTGSEGAAWERARSEGAAWERARSEDAAWERAGSRVAGSEGAASDGAPTDGDRAGGAEQERAAEAAPDGATADATPTEATPVQGSPAGAAPDEAGEPDGSDQLAAAQSGGRQAETASRNGAAAADEPADTQRPMPVPRPRPTTPYRGLPVPSTPYEVHAGAGRNGENGPDENGAGESGTPEHEGAQNRLDPAGGAPTPHTTPLPVVPDGERTTAAGAFSAPPEPDDGRADALFAPSVPAISEPDGLPRSRRPLAELRRGPVDIAETTPIFAEIASAWFASHRPVPVDWELGERPGSGTGPTPEVAEELPAAAAPDTPPDGDGRPVDVTAPDPSAQSFATLADEGWRAASGAAAERPDELTAAGLPKRRPRARLVPGSAGSAVLAAPVPPTRSAESIRGRLSSYQQGVRQGREIRHRRGPGSAGPQPASTGENDAAPAGGDHDEESR